MTKQMSAYLSQPDQLTNLLTVTIVCFFRQCLSIFTMDVKISLLLLLMVSGFVSRTAHVTRKCNLFQIMLRVYMWKFSKEKRQMS